jgi:hypothetical protein
VLGHNPDVIPIAIMYVLSFFCSFQLDLHENIIGANAKQAVLDATNEAGDHQLTIRLEGDDELSM